MKYGTPVQDNKPRLKSGLTPELAIEIFGEDARQPVCDNLMRYCDTWLVKKKQIVEMADVSASLPSTVNKVSLRGIYEDTIPKLQRELYVIEHHIRRLQLCLEILEQKKIFSQPVDIPGHIDVATLKGRLDIIGVVGREIELRQTGSTYKGRCPFHEDHNPSLIVYPKDGSWWCFGCNNGGDAISFVRKIRNCGFREAVKELERL